MSYFVYSDFRPREIYNTILSLTSQERTKKYFKTLQTLFFLGFTLIYKYIELLFILFCFNAYDYVSSHVRWVAILFYTTYSEKMFYKCWVSIYRFGYKR